MLFGDVRLSSHFSSGGQCANDSLSEFPYTRGDLASHNHWAPEGHKGVKAAWGHVIARV